MESKKNLLDSAASLLTVLTEMLGTKQPQRFGIGLMIGIAISGFITVFRPYIENNYIHLSGISDITGFQCLAFGLTIVYFPLILRFLNPRREEFFDEKLEKSFLTLRKAFKDGGIPQKEKRFFYTQLVQKVIDSVELNEGMKNKIRYQDELDQLDKINEALNKRSKESP